MFLSVYMVSETLYASLTLPVSWCVDKIAKHNHILYKIHGRFSSDVGTPALSVAIRIGSVP